MPFREKRVYSLKVDFLGFTVLKQPKIFEPEGQVCTCESLVHSH